MFYTVDFGKACTSAFSVGVTQIGADGSVVVERTQTGIVALGNGAFGATLTPDPACVMLRWDTGSQPVVYAHESIFATCTID